MDARGGLKPDPLERTAVLRRALRGGREDGCRCSRPGVAKGRLHPNLCLSRTSTRQVECCAPCWRRRSRRSGWSRCGCAFNSGPATPGARSIIRAKPIVVTKTNDDVSRWADAGSEARRCAGVALALPFLTRHTFSTAAAVLITRRGALTARMLSASRKGTIGTRSRFDFGVQRRICSYVRL
jgi:hypothetical protein